MGEALITKYWVKNTYMIEGQVMEGSILSNMDKEMKETTFDTSPLKLELSQSNKSVVKEGYVEVGITGGDILENVSEVSEGIDVPKYHYANKKTNDESVIINKGSCVERNKLEVLSGENVELNMQSTEENIGIDNTTSPTEGIVHVMSNNGGVIQKI
ncbi:hypothetical protein K7X08_026307 [Anisodus acutangulus]|uniref:Uncharacterized protein n=1 Tax=Anisodus acutangulus TaxID=402998 RepID=A0A9Q1R2U0_9SOLA|nr:hypothetical protein K7X08_026307 [Anisodus acutangulus]